MLDWGIITNEMAAWVFNILYGGVIIGTILVIILDNRNPVKTLAWILVLMFLPIIGLILYIFFGRNGRKVRIISKKSYSRLIKKAMDEYLEEETCTYPSNYSRLISLFQHTDQAFPFDGNKIDIYTDGTSMLQALLSALQQAEHHIHMEFYIFENDAIGRQVRDTLIAKARSGVEVRLIYDDVGCWHVPHEFFETMRESGVDARSFFRVRFPAFTSSVNYRNHRKIVVIDGRIGFVGGMNLADRYVKGFSWGDWRDTHLRIEGKAVHGLQTTFLLDWYFVDRTLLTNTHFFPNLPNKGSSLAQIVTSNPIGPWKEIMQGFLMVIASAKKYIYIQTPYFLPTETVMLALQTAALSGVDVRLMLPMRSDSKLTHFGSCSYVADALQAGIKIYFYKKGFLHSKLLVSDDELSSVGSTNLDFRSFEHNFEVNAFIYDKDTANQLHRIFQMDQRNCVQVFPKTWGKRPWYWKIAESIVRLMAPLL